jgi:hypothetical protein
MGQLRRDVRRFFRPGAGPVPLRRALELSRRAPECLPFLLDCDMKALRRAYQVTGLDRIMFSRNRKAVPAKHVNPIDLIVLEQIHRAGGSPKAIPSDPDLL